MPGACVLGQRRVQSTREEAGPAPCPPAGSAAQSSLALRCVLPYPPDTGLCPGPAASSPNGQIQSSCLLPTSSPLEGKGRPLPSGAEGLLLSSEHCVAREGPTPLCANRLGVRPCPCGRWPAFHGRHACSRHSPALSKRVTINRVTLRI